MATSEKISIKLKNGPPLELSLDKAREVYDVLGELLNAEKKDDFAAIKELIERENAKRILREPYPVPMPYPIYPPIPRPYWEITYLSNSAKVTSEAVRMIS